MFCGEDSAVTDICYYQLVGVKVIMDSHMSNGLDQPSSDGGNGKRQVQGISFYIHVHVDAALPTINPLNTLTSVVQSKSNCAILIYR